jgi:hypothetical protein
MNKKNFQKVITDVNKVIKSKESNLSKKDLESLVTIRENLKSATDKKGILYLLWKALQMCGNAGLIKFIIEHYKDH